ncbi:MAG: UvrD-helicase domain-containing protein [Clostridiales bacterium]|nr:UvrD-helicase domain-containing protein [Clostridiales bacterium]
MDILNGLNDQQLKAVTAPPGQTLVIAGAGSGKTRVLVSRVAWLIAEQKAAPTNILAATFTNKAAREMKERLAAITGLPTRYMWIGTFHSLCARLLRREGGHIAPLNADFNIYDDGESRSLMKKCLVSLGLGEDKRFHPASVLNAVSAAKNSLIDPAGYGKTATNDWQQTVARLYSDYQRRLTAANALDFDDLLMQAVALLRKEPQILQHYRTRFKHILVDEYQDTNHSQYQLVRLLSGEDGDLFAVGDPDQSIYRWRGADIGNIMDFSRDYPACREISLTQNYRSRQNILDAANALISHNENRKPKELFSARGEGEKIRLHQSADDREEAYFIIDNIARLRNSDFTLCDCAVLYRTHGQSRLLEDQCRRFGLPYRIYGGMKFYERKEVKDTLAYLRFLANPRDTEALNRIYNEPKRGIGKASWDKLAARAAAEDIALAELLREPERCGGIPAATVKSLRALTAHLKAWGEYAKTASMKELLQRLWLQSGYRDMVAALPDAEERLEILEELYNTAAAFDEEFAEIAAFSGEEQLKPLTAFLGQLALATDMDNPDERADFLTLMTLHAAKGLEFPVVFMAGLEEGLFPHQRVLLSDSEEEMEEERRLCYVGMTRAKERLFISSAARRLQRGSYVPSRPSRFLQELPAKNIEKSGFTPQRRAQTRPAERLTDNVFAPRPKPPAPAPPSADRLIGLGDKVRHAKFGDGVVVTVTGSGEDMQMAVAFPGQGVKQLMWRYAPMKKI